MSCDLPEDTSGPSGRVGSAIVRAGVHGLPPDLLRECSNRLGVASLVWGGLWLLAAVAHHFLPPALTAGRPLDGAWPWPGDLVAALSIAVSLGLFAYTRRTGCDSKLSLDLGLFYEVLLAFGIGLVGQWSPSTSGISWIAFLVLVHPMIVPNSMRNTLLVGLAAASMDPVGVGIAAVRGVPIPPVAALFWVFLPNYLAAVLAVLPARIISRLGREVDKARELGSYHLGELIGRGGMGEVYRARHRILRRPAAVKLIRPDRTEVRSGEAWNTVAQRFWREAEAAASLSSPHAIALYDFGLTPDGSFYYVMELLDGMDLESLVERFGPVTPGRAVYLLRQACHALAEAHSIGLVHRDIKPANLFACRAGLETDFVKVLDFGLVKFTGSDSPQELRETAPGFATGTPAYMAPEVARGKRAIDRQVDIYALGGVAYWLLTGRLVFEADTPMKMMIAHIEQEPMPPSGRTELVIPRCLDELVLACLAKDPANRPPDAATLASLLAACDVGEPWTAELAERWWRKHLPRVLVADRSAA